MTELNSTAFSAHGYTFVRALLRIALCGALISAVLSFMDHADRDGFLFLFVALVVVLWDVSFDLPPAARRELQHTVLGPSFTPKSPLQIDREATERARLTLVATGGSRVH